MSYNKTNVVIGRFQVPYLTDGHIYLLEEASREANLLILVGSVVAQPTKKNPLSFEVRKAMLRSAYPKAIIIPVYDHPSDREWSKQVDQLIQDYSIADPLPKNITLICSRDSFKDHYSGKYPVKVLEEVPNISGTELREQIAKTPINSSIFRAGVIHSVYNRYPGVYLCTDVAILTDREDCVLLARKPGMDKWQFVGGFVDPSDLDVQAAAKREVQEETNLQTLNYETVGTFRIDDYRYRNTEAAMFSVLFKCKVQPVSIWKAGDDIAELQWFPLDNFRRQGYKYDTLEPLHHSLMNALLENVLRIK